MNSPKMLSKAERLRDEGRVQLVPDGQVWRVEGDGDTYLVVHADGVWHCNCPAVEQCYHQLAVKRELRSMLRRSLSRTEA